MAGLHAIDRDATGQLLTDELFEGDALRETYAVDSLREEAIASSQLEGEGTGSPNSCP